MQHPAPRTLVLAAALVLTAGCASAGTGGGSHASPNDVITKDQIEQTSGNDAYAVVQRLQSQWLRGQVVVYMDNRAEGSASSLRDIPTANIEYIEYFTSTQAMSRFPEATQGASVILVSSRPR